MRMGEDDWDAVLDTNLQRRLPLRQGRVPPDASAQRSGRIVNVTSVVGLVGNAGQTNYTAPRLVWSASTKSLAKEVGSRGITVNAVAPGFIATRLTDVLPAESKEMLLKQTPLGRFGTPEDVAGAVAFLVCPRRLHHRPRPDGRWRALHGLMRHRPLVRVRAGRAMPSKRKLYLKALNNPVGLRLEEFTALIEAFGFVFPDSAGAIASTLARTWPSG